MNCYKCEDDASIRVQWCSRTSPWSADMCEACCNEAWEACQRIGGVDGWSMSPIKSPPKLEGA